MGLFSETERELERANGHSEKLLANHERIAAAADRWTNAMLRVPTVLGPDGKAIYSGTGGAKGGLNASGAAGMRGASGGSSTGGGAFDSQPIDATPADTGAEQFYQQWGAGAGGGGNHGGGSTSGTINDAKTLAREWLASHGLPTGDDWIAALSGAGGYAYNPSPAAVTKAHDYLMAHPGQLPHQSSMMGSGQGVTGASGPGMVGSGQGLTGSTGGVGGSSGGRVPIHGDPVQTQLLQSIAHSLATINRDDYGAGLHAKGLI